MKKLEDIPSVKISKLGLFINECEKMDLMLEFKREFAKAKKILSDLDQIIEDQENEINRLSKINYYLEDKSIDHGNTLPEIMKLEKIRDNWNQITLEQIESLCKY
jgi:hypothetical protein